MDVKQCRFDHKSSIEGRCRSYLNVWWALHGWGITNGWRLRRVYEAKLAETDDWWTYPNGRVHYTKLRNHMKELVDEIIEDAIDKGFVTTRKKPGPKHVSGSTLLDPIVCMHTIEYSQSQQRCQLKGCDKRIHTYCPGCAAADGEHPSSGFYCFGPHRNCLAANHRKRARTHADTDSA